MTRKTLKHRSLSKKNIPIVGYTVVNKYPHTLPAFTEGIEYHDGHMIESCLAFHRNDKSLIRKVNLATGKVIKEVNLDKKYMAEGCTQLNGKIYQLTWKNHVCFIYDLDLNKIGEFKYEGEGWGLTNDGTSLIMSNGSNIIQFIDPKTFLVTRTIKVGNLKNLNGLSYINNVIYANIWWTDKIVCIDPKTGNIIKYIDFSNIYPLAKGESVLNGIAYDRAKKRMFVTGKNWPTIFEVKIDKKPLTNNKTIKNKTRKHGLKINK
jgi:glutamine cyclotransferase